MNNETSADSVRNSGALVYVWATAQVYSTEEPILQDFDINACYATCGCHFGSSNRASHASSNASASIGRVSNRETGGKTRRTMRNTDTQKSHARCDATKNHDGNSSEVDEMSRRAQINAAPPAQSSKILCVAEAVRSLMSRQHNYFLSKNYRCRICPPGQSDTVSDLPETASHRA